MLMLLSILTQRNTACCLVAGVHLERVQFTYHQEWSRFFLFILKIPTRELDDFFLDLVQISSVTF
jgi:hypothetical protein